MKMTAITLKVILGMVSVFDFFLETGGERGLMRGQISMKLCLRILLGRMVIGTLFMRISICLKTRYGPCFISIGTGSTSTNWHLRWS